LKGGANNNHGGWGRNKPRIPQIDELRAKLRANSHPTPFFKSWYKLLQTAM